MVWDTNAGVGGVGWERSPAARDDVVETSVPGKYRGTCVGWVGRYAEETSRSPPHRRARHTGQREGCGGRIRRAVFLERDGIGRNGTGRVVSDRIRSDRIRSDRIGSDRIGSDRIGSVRFGSDRIRWDHLDRIGSSGTGQDGTGEGWCPAYSTNTAHHTAHLKLRQKATLDFQVVQAPPPLLHLKSLCRISAPCTPYFTISMITSHTSN